MNAIDTNVFAYAFGDMDDPRQPVAATFIADCSSHDHILLWQVAVELGAVMHKLHRTGRLQSHPDAVVDGVRERFQVVLPTVNALAVAADLRTKHAVSYWDSVLIGACIDAGISTLYTEDRQSAPEIAGVKIVNPLV